MRILGKTCLHIKVYNPYINGPWNLHYARCNIRYIRETCLKFLCISDDLSFIYLSARFLDPSPTKEEENRKKHNYYYFLIILLSSWPNTQYYHSAGSRLMIFINDISYHCWVASTGKIMFTLNCININMNSLYLGYILTSSIRCYQTNL